MQKYKSDFLLEGSVISLDFHGAIEEQIRNQLMNTFISGRKVNIFLYFFEKFRKKRQKKEIDLLNGEFIFFVEIILL